MQFAGVENLPLVLLEFLRIGFRDDVDRLPADDLPGRLAEDCREGVVGEDEIQVSVLDEDRVGNAVDDRFGELGLFERLGQRRLAVLHLGDVEVGDQPLAARKRSHRIYEGAAVGALEFTRRDLAGADFRDARCGIFLPSGLGDVIDAGIAIVVDQVSEMRANADLFRIHSPLFVEGGVDDFGAHVGVDDYDAHVHRLDGPRQVEQKFLGVAARLGKLLLAFLHLGDIRADAHDAAVPRTDLAAHDPSPVREMQHHLGARTFLAPLHGGGDIGVDIRLADIHHAEFDGLAQHRLESHARADMILHADMHLHIGRIEQHKAVAGVVKREAVLHDVERRSQDLGVAGLFERFGEGLFPLLDGGDVGPQPDEHAVVEAPVAQMHPAAVVEFLLALAVGLPAFLETFPQPARAVGRPRRILGAGRVDELAGIIGTRQQVAELHPRFGDLADMGIEFGHAGVGEQKAVILVVHDDAGVERFEHGGQKFLRLLELAAHLIQRVLCVEQVRDVPAGALVAGESTVFGEQRIAGNRQPAAMSGRVRHLIDEFAKGPMRPQIGEVRLVVRFQPGGHRQEIEPGLAERLFRLHSGRAFEPVGKKDEYMVGVGPPYPVGAYFEKPARIGTRHLDTGAMRARKRIGRGARRHVRNAMFLLFSVPRCHRTRP